MKKLFQITAICGAAALLTGCHKAEPPAAEAPAPKVEGSTIVFPADAPTQNSLNVETAQPQKIAITHMTGRLYWNDNVTVRIFTPVAGRVTALRADLGQRLREGAALADIDSPDFGQAQADARTAEGNLRAAEKAFSRAKELLAHGAAAQKDVENAEAADIAAVAARDSSHAKLALYGGGETDTNEIYVLRSPMAGMLVERNINPGQEVRADQMLANAPNLFAPLFVITDPSQLWLQLDVAESDLSEVQPGQRLRIYSRAFPNVTFDGVVDNIGAEMDPITRTVRVRGSVNNTNLLLKAEMYVLVDALADPAPAAAAAVEIPATAVFQRDNQSYLFVERSPGQYQRQLVKTGAEQDGKTLILEGIRPGEKVVTDGCLLLEALFEAANQS
jgi:cobalt-zinc-cadmium efflux system membrane fusion protein